jgi:hypothetical protein
MLHHDPMDSKIDEFFEITDIPVHPFAKVVSFVIPQPRRTLGARLDARLRDSSFDTIAKEGFAHLLSVTWVKVDQVVFDEKLQRFAIPHAADLMQTSLFRLVRLIPDLTEGRRYVMDTLIKGPCLGRKGNRPIEDEWGALFHCHGLVKPDKKVQTVRGWTLEYHL